VIAFLYGTSHHRELGGNDRFEASTIAPEIRVLRQVVNWHKKKKIWRLFGKLPVFVLSLFGCGFRWYSFFSGWFFSLLISSRSFPPSHTQGWILPPDPSDFSFPIIHRHWFPGGNFFVVGFFGFVISLVTEMKRGDGRGQ